MKKMIIAISTLLYLYATGFDMGDGAPIRQGVHIEWYRTIAPGNTGEAIFIWSDTRFGMRNIFAHKINAQGEFLWGNEGAVVTNLPGRQEDPVAITDGSGGVFIAWVDYRFDEQGDIFFQHLDNNGQILLDENGVALAQVEGKQITINMCTDSLGGVFVTWQDKRGGVDDDIYGTHISADHSIVSPGTGVPIVVEIGNQNAKTIEYAGNNQAFIAWADFREGANADIYGQRLSMAMEVIFEENGLPIASTDDQELKPRATFVSNNTSFLSWKKGDENSRILYQFIDENGMVFDEERIISAYDALQTAPRVKRSAIGEVFVNWKDLRDDPLDGDQYFQKVDVNGDIQWGDGIRLDLVDDIDFSARFVAGLNGDLNVIWERGTFPEVDVFFQNIDSNGNYTNGTPLPISNASGYQFAPILMGDVENGLYGIYADQGTGSIDLKVQMIDSDYGPVWEENGLVSMVGLDGDVNYTNTYRIDEEDLYLLWEDNRASKKIYGTRLTSLELSETNGKQLTFSDNSSSETDFSTPKKLKTSTGIYVATFDGSSSPKNIRLNRLDDELENVWDSSGVSLDAVFDMRSVFLTETTDGLGVFWSESRGFNYAIYYQNIDTEGNTLLENQGVEMVDSNNGDDYIMAVLPTPDGKYMIFWMEDAWPAASLKYSKVDDQGDTEIGWNPNGNELSNANFDSRNLQVKVSNNGSGILAIWSQDGNFSDIYAQFIDWDGNTLWDEGGIAISEEDNDQVNVSFEFNQTGSHAFIGWQDYRNGSDFEIFGNTIEISNGEIGQEDIQFSSDTTDQYNPKVVSIQSNEFFIIWEDERGYYNEDPLLINGVDLYGSGYIIGQGMTTSIDGIPICIAYHKQQDINVTHYKDNEYFLDWVDYRSSGKEDLANYYGRTLMKAELLSSSSCEKCSNIPKEFQLSAVYPNPFNGRVSFEFYMQDKESLELFIYNIKGDCVFDRLILPSASGNYRIDWIPVSQSGQSLSSGIYFYEFRHKDNIAKGKLTYLK